VPSVITWCGVLLGEGEDDQGGADADHDPADEVDAVVGDVVVEDDGR
jgi:hypothetical protein